MYISRDSIIDAKYVIEGFIPDRISREIVLNFLVNKINYASKIDNSNWNLNLDKRGKFLRFNVGHEYCIQINKKRVLILCLREELKNTLKNSHNIVFKGYRNGKRELSRDIDGVDDCLKKVPDSVGCLIRIDNIKNDLQKLEKANRSFLEYAIKNTTILASMRYVHSFGAINYIEKEIGKKIPTPSYSFDFNELQKRRIQFENEIKKLSLRELKQRALESSKNIKKIVISSSQFVRNPFVSEYAKRKANGICQDCKKMAPFINRYTKEPYLETHHIIPLSQGGSDTIDNVIALCPNCHRKRHYG